MVDSLAGRCVASLAGNPVALTVIGRLACGDCDVTAIVGRDAVGLGAIGTFAVGDGGMVGVGGCCADMCRTPAPKAALHMNAVMNAMPSNVRTRRDAHAHDGHTVRREWRSRGEIPIAAALYRNPLDGIVVGRSYVTDEYPLPDEAKKSHNERQKTMRQTTSAMRRVMALACIAHLRHPSQPTRICGKR